MTKNSDFIYSKFVEYSNKIADFANGKVSLPDFHNYIMTENWRLNEKDAVKNEIIYDLIGEMCLTLCEYDRGHRTEEDVRVIAYRTLYQRFFKTKILVRSQIEALNTKRLLEYRKSLLRWYNKSSSDDIWPDSENRPDGKDSQVWTLVYNIVKEVLATREHVDG